MPNTPVTIGDTSTGLSVNATVGLLVNTTWDGSQQSGMLGLAAPIWASSDGPENSVLNFMSIQYGQPRQFTLALSRNPATGGYLTLGSAIPPNAVPINSPGVFQQPMQRANINGRYGNLYSLMASVAIMAAAPAVEQYVIDSGEVYLRIPPSTAAAINAAWNPTAVRLNDSGLYSVECTAAAPAIGLTIGSRTFPFNTGDLLWKDQTGCYSKVVEAQNETYVLGIPFLENVIATFDLDNQMIYIQQGLDTTVFTATNLPGTGIASVTAGPSSLSSASAATSKSILPTSSALSASIASTPTSASASPSSSMTSPSTPVVASALKSTSELPFTSSTAVAGSSWTTWYAQGPIQQELATQKIVTSTTTTYLVATSTSYVTNIVTVPTA